MEVTGELVAIMDEQQISGTFKKREFVVKVVEESSQYSETIKMEMIQDKCSLLDNMSLGSIVTASINLKGRKWTDNQGVDKYFNSIQCWQLK